MKRIGSNINSRGQHLSFLMIASSQCVIAIRVAFVIDDAIIIFSSSSERIRSVQGQESCQHHEIYIGIASAAATAIIIIRSLLCCRILLYFRSFCWALKMVEEQRYKETMEDVHSSCWGVKVAQWGNNRKYDNDIDIDTIMRVVKTYLDARARDHVTILYLAQAVGQPVGRTQSAGGTAECVAGESNHGKKGRRSRLVGLVVIHASRSNQC